MTRTLIPTRILGAQVWQVTVPGDASYRILAKGAQWRMQERSLYGGAWQTVPTMDIPTFVALHHLTLAQA